MTSDGRIGRAIRATAARPVSSAATRRSACTAGMAAVPGSDMPNASAMQAMVLAVPITAQVPAVVARRPSTWSISARSTVPARYLPQKLRQSVQAPRRCPRWRPVLIGPVTSWMAGRLAEAAPMSCAGTVLSHPPISTTASIGWAAIISSVSMAARLRYIMLVGLRNTSPSDTVGNGRGRAPAASTPRQTASTSSGIVRWQLLNPDGVMTTPTTGRSSRVVEMPMERAKDRRRNRAKSRSP